MRPHTWKWAKYLYYGKKSISQSSTYLWARQPADTDPTRVIRSCTKKTQFNSRKLALVWQPRSNKVGPKIATPIPKLPNTRQSVMTDTQFSLRSDRKWGLLSPSSVTRGSKVMGAASMTDKILWRSASSLKQVESFAFHPSLEIPKDLSPMTNETLYISLPRLFVPCHPHLRSRHYNPLCSVVLRSITDEGARTEHLAFVPLKTRWSVYCAALQKAELLMLLIGVRIHI